MTQRARTTLTLSVRLPLPPGMTQAKLLERIEELIRADTRVLSVNEVIIKIAKRETHYL